MLIMSISLFVALHLQIQTQPFMSNRLGKKSSTLLNVAGHAVLQRHTTMPSASRSGDADDSAGANRWLRQIAIRSSLRLDRLRGDPGAIEEGLLLGSIFTLQCGALFELS